MIQRKIFIITCLLFFASSVEITAMPPHPDVVKRYRDRGKIAMLQSRLTAMKESGKDSPQKSFPTTGTRKVLVILVGFSDLSLDGSSTTTFYGNLFNGGGATTLTWKKYYQDMSNNQLNLEFTIVNAGDALNNLAYYGANVSGPGTDQNPAELVQVAVNNADASVDFADFDNDGDGYVDVVVIIHAGRGEESGASTDTIWSHRWSLSDAGVGTVSYDGKTIDDYSIQPEYVFSVGDSTIGVFAHEFGHVLGLPDLYDTTYTTEGVGKWSLMASGSWNGPSGKGSVPAPLIAWEKAKLGWITVEQASFAKANVNNPVVIASGGILGVLLLIGSVFAMFGRKRGTKRIALLLLLLIPAGFSLYISCGGDDDGTKPQTFSLENIETGHRAVKIPLNSSLQQYLLIENKVITSGTWTEYLPGGGLLITHIDDRLNNLLIPCNAVNYFYVMNNLLHGVTIEEADGDFALWQGTDYGSATDTYHAGYKAEITPSTTPNTNYQNWSYTGSDCSTYNLSINTMTVSSGVYVDNISEKGDTMTFRAYK